jgi:thiamine-monophosphate kinase
MVRRSSAKAGDSIMVSGTIGDAALGLRLRRDRGLAVRWRLPEPLGLKLQQRYLLPEPRNALAEAVREHASAAMDISDGLAGDLAKLCRASALAAEIDVARVPLSEAARAALACDASLIETILTGGDDYEIAATLAPDRVAPFATAAARAGVAVAAIGRVVKGQGARFLSDGKPLTFAQASFSHF